MVSSRFFSACRFVILHRSPQESLQKKSALSAPVMSRILAHSPHSATLGGMQTDAPLLDLATKYHKALPARIRRYLNDRGIPDLVIDSHLLGWHESRIAIPIFNRMG